MLHADQIAELRRAQIAKVRAWLGRSDASHNGLAKQAGITDTVLRRIDDPDWNPRQEKLDALERAIDREDESVHLPLVAVDLNDRQVSEVDRFRNGIARQIWAEADGIWSAAIEHRLRGAGVLTMATLIRDTERGLLVESQGEPLAVGKSRGAYLLDRIDQDYDRFVYDRLMRCLLSETPVYQRCRGWCGMAGRNLAWSPTLLPFRASQSGPVDRILSVCLPERERLAA